MHGLVNRSIQCFVRDTYGGDTWLRVASVARLDPDGFEAMLHYEDRTTDLLLETAAQVLDKPRESILEDLGAFLVSLEPLRRLLRFGGVDYVDFLGSLDDLAERAHLAIPDLDFPTLAVRHQTEGNYLLTCRSRHAGAGHVFAGLLRAMADDYGVLALIEILAATPGEEGIAVTIHEALFATARSFDLAQPEAS